MSPCPNPERDGKLDGQTNIIKLHGSFNWHSSNGDNLLVAGTDKVTQIDALPLLAWYYRVFEHVLCAGDVRLMIVGYGFGDEHINAAIASGIEKHGLSVFIWDTGANIKERVLAAPFGQVIWNGLMSMATRPMIEVFPSDQSTTEEYRRIRDSFF